MVLASKVGSNWRASSVTACTKPSTLAPMTLMGNLDGYSINESLRGSLACVSRPLAGGGLEVVMVRTASVSIAGGALPLCASGVVVLPLGCRQPAPGQCTAVRKGSESRWPVTTTAHARAPVLCRALSCNTCFYL